MDNYNEVKEAEATNKVRFSITPDGKVEFDAQGLEDWRLSDAIYQTREAAQDSQKARQKLKEVAAAENIAMHCLAIAFFTFLTFGATFTLSRLVSSTFSQHQVEVAK
jgi:hypothetical protein